MSFLVARSSIADLVCSRIDRSAAAVECCAALRATSVETLECSTVERVRLAQTYRMRLARNPDTVLGADELLRDLEAHEGTYVTSCVLEWQGQVFGIICDEQISDVVACLVGEDRRVGGADSSQ